MITRCHRSTASDYERYGGRGITVCERWREGFANFLQDMGARPEGTTLDRIDNDGNYEPSNCRWATAVEQQRNRKVARLVKLRREVVTIEHASRLLGVARSVVAARVAEHGDAQYSHSAERLSRHPSAVWA
jgi:hypothetical protein